MCDSLAQSNYFSHHCGAVGAFIIGESSLKGYSILLLAVCFINLIVALTISVGYFGYQVYTLDQRVKNLEKLVATSNAHGTEQTRRRNTRSVGQVDSGLICQQLKDSCSRLCGNNFLKVSKKVMLFKSRTLRNFSVCTIVAKTGLSGFVC